MMSAITAATLILAKRIVEALLVAICVASCRDDRDFGLSVQDDFAGNIYELGQPA
jgi:hypothetical protein